MKYDLTSPVEIDEFRQKLDDFLMQHTDLLTGQDENGAVRPTYALYFLVGNASPGLIINGIDISELLDITALFDRVAYDKHVFAQAIDLLRANDMGNFARQLEDLRAPKKTLGSMFSGDANAVS